MSSTTQKEHAAALLSGATAPFHVGSIPTISPTANEVLIRVSALAINPVDWKIQDAGSFIKSWPAVLGEDIAGTIESVGSDVTRLSAGQRVLAHCQFLVSQRNQDGGFQELVLVPEIAVALIPDEMRFEDAAVLPLAISTAAAGLYLPKADMCLGLPLPSAQPPATGKVVLIWGGSSSVGTAAIQLARASGVDVVTTCSRRNFALVERLGAKAFDHGSPSVVGDLVAELQKGEFVGGFDAIGVRESSMQSAQIIAQFGGGVLANVLPPPEDIPATVQSKWFFAPAIFMGGNDYIGRTVYERFLPQALKSGQIKPAPDADVVGKGLDAVQDACQKQKAGVSAKKIVVSL